MRTGSRQQLLVPPLHPRSRLLYLGISLCGEPTGDVSIVLGAKVHTSESRKRSEMTVFLLREKDLLESFLVVKNLPKVLIRSEGGYEEPGHFLRVDLELKGLLLLDAAHDGLLLLLVDVLDLTAEEFEAASVGLILDGSDGLLGGGGDALLD